MRPITAVLAALVAMALVVPARATTFRFPLVDPYAESILPDPIGCDHDPVNHGGTGHLCLAYDGAENFPHCYDEHEGTDFILAGGFAAMDAGSVPVVAAADGTVIAAVDGNFDRCAADASAPGGISCKEVVDGEVVQHPLLSNHVWIRHADGLETGYYHLKKGSVLVSVGQTVACGDVIGLVGSSGISATPHLHFEVSDGAGGFVDPYAGVASQATSYWVQQEGCFGLPGALCEGQIGDACDPEVVTPEPIADSAEEAVPSSDATQPPADVDTPKETSVDMANDESPEAGMVENDVLADASDDEGAIAARAGEGCSYTPSSAGSAGGLLLLCAGLGLLVVRRLRRRLGAWLVVGLMGCASGGSATLVPLDVSTDAFLSPDFGEVVTDQDVIESHDIWTEAFLEDGLDPDAGDVGPVDAQDDAVAADGITADAAEDTLWDDPGTIDDALIEVTDTTTEDLLADLLGEVPCDPSVIPEAPIEVWQRLDSYGVVLLGAANHRGQDVVTNPGKPQVLIGKFAYGATDKDLKGEWVDVFVQASFCGPWKKLGSALTSDEGEHGDTYGVPDDGGMVFFEVPAADRLGRGVWPVAMRVRGDHSMARVNLYVVSPGTTAVVFDIDGTLTVSDAEIWSQVADPDYVPVMFAEADRLTRTWASKEYLLFYLTGRPNLLMNITRDWLTGQGFAPGVVHVTDTDGQIYPTNNGVGRFKAEFLTRMQGLDITFFGAHGNAKTDIFAYQSAGIPNARIFIIGPNGGKEGTVAVTSYPSLIPIILTLGDGNYTP